MWMLRLLQQQQRWEVHSRRDALAAQSICLSTSAAVPLLGCPATITWLQRSRAATGEAFNKVNLQLLFLEGWDGAGRGAWSCCHSRERDPKPTGTKGKTEVLRKKPFASKAFSG